MSGKQLTTKYQVLLGIIFFQLNTITTIISRYCSFLDPLRWKIRSSWSLRETEVAFEAFSTFMY